MTSQSIRYSLECGCCGSKVNENLAKKLRSQGITEGSQCEECINEQINKIAKEVFELFREKKERGQFTKDLSKVKEKLIDGTTENKFYTLAKINDTGLNLGNTKSFQLRLKALLELSKNG